MILEKWSKKATNLREHTSIIGLPAADILFLIILIIAKVTGDWRREVGELGQLALDLKRLADIFTWKSWQKFFLNLSLNWMEKCLDVCIKKGADIPTRITYQFERVSCIINMLEKGISTIPGVDNPVDFAFGALAYMQAEAEIYYSSFVCRIATKTAKLLLLNGQTVKAITVAEEAFADGVKYDAHPSHMAEALIVYALAEGKLFADSGFTIIKLQEALKFAQQYNLALRIREIASLIRKISKK